MVRPHGPKPPRQPSISLLECRVAPLRQGDQSCLDRFEALFAQPDLLVVELSASVVELATQLRANHGLRTPDALLDFQGPADLAAWLAANA